MEYEKIDTVYPDCVEQYGLRDAKTKIPVGAEFFELEVWWTEDDRPDYSIHFYKRKSK